MANQPRKPSQLQVKAGGTLQAIEMTLPSVRDIPLLYANKVVINFTGTEFLVTLVSAYPEPWFRGQEPPKKIEGQVLGRYAFNIPEWVAAAKSIGEQIERLEGQGAFKVQVEFGQTAEELE